MLEMSDIKDIINKFSINKKARRIWEFLDKYMYKIEKWLITNTFSQKQLERYMIVGFFPEYRACNHRGESFSTLLNTNFIDKSKIFNNYCGYAIITTNQYLTSLTVSDFKNLNEDSLFNFVIYGKKIG